MLSYCVSPDIQWAYLDPDHASIKWINPEVSDLELFTESPYPDPNL